MTAVTIIAEVAQAVAIVSASWAIISGIGAWKRTLPILGLLTSLHAQDITLVRVSRGTFYFKRGTLSIQAKCVSSDHCWLAGLPGDSHKEDTSQHCEGNKDGEVRYGLNATELYFQKFGTDVEGKRYLCGQAEQSLFKIVSIGPSKKGNARKGGGD